jgi:hypothetical protein
MAKPRRPDVFPPDRSLQARMLLVLLMGLAFDAALIAAVRQSGWIAPPT